MIEKTLHSAISVLEILVKGHHGMGLHVRPRVGAGAIAAGAYANDAADRLRMQQEPVESKPNHDFPTSLSGLKQFGQIDTINNQCIYVDQSGTKYVVHAASFSDNPSLAEDRIRAEMLSDSLYQSLFSANPNIKINIPQSETFMHDGKLCKITKQIVSDSAQSRNDDEIIHLQKQITAVNGLLGFSGDEQPTVVRLSDGKIYLVNNSEIRSKWTSQNISEEFAQKTELLQMKSKLSSLEKTIFDVAQNDLDLMEKKPVFDHKSDDSKLIFGVIFEKTMRDSGVNRYAEYTKIEPKHYLEIEKNIRDKKLLLNEDVRKFQAQISYLKGETNDLSMFNETDQNHLKSTRNGPRIEIENSINLYTNKLNSNKKSLEILSSKDFEDSYSNWKKQRTAWDEEFEPNYVKKKELRAEYSKTLDDIYTLTSEKMKPLSEQRAILESEQNKFKTYSKQSNLNIGLGDGVDEIFGSLQNMSPDEVFSSIKFAKETAIAARNSMNTSVSAIISDSALKKAILDKLDSRINSLSKLDTVYTRMLSDSGVSFNKEYLLEFGKHYQGITSDLIPQKHFKESMNFFNLGGTLPKKFTEYDQQTFAQSSSLKDAILGVSNFYPTKYSTCDESLLQGFHTSVASYMSYSGVGNDTRKSDGWSKSFNNSAASLVDDWTQSQGQNSVTGLAGGARLGFVSQIMKYDDKAVSWGKVVTDSGTIPMTKLDLMASLVGDSSVIDYKKLTIGASDIREAIRQIQDVKIEKDKYIKLIKNGENSIAATETVVDYLNKSKLSSQSRSEIETKIENLSQSSLKTQYQNDVQGFTQDFIDIQNFQKKSDTLKFVNFDSLIHHAHQNLSELRYTNMRYSVFEGSLDRKNNFLRDAFDNDQSLSEKMLTLHHVNNQDDFIKQWCGSSTNTNSEIPLWKKELNGFNYSLNQIKEKLQNDNTEDAKIMIQKVDSLQKNVLSAQNNMQKFFDEQYNEYQLKSRLQEHDIASGTFIKNFDVTKKEFQEKKKTYQEKIKTQDEILEEWKPTIDSYSEDLTNALKTGLHTQFGDGMTVQHAITYSMLENIAAPQHDKTTGTVTLYRTESNRRILESLKQNETISNNDDPVGKVITIPRALTDSFSAFAPVSIGNQNVSVQEVPFHRVLGAFFGKQLSSTESDSANLFLGKDELEYLVMPVGIQSKYLGNMIGSDTIRQNYPNLSSYIFEDGMKNWESMRINPYGDGYLPASKAPTFTDLSYDGDFS